MSVRENLQHPDLALCLGGADCVWDDLLAWEAIYGRPWDGVVIAANDVGAHWPREVDHWVTLHENKMLRWWQLRRRHGFQMDGIRVWSRTPRRGSLRLPPDIIHETLVPWSGGSSGMLAVQVAHTVGCTRAILCGIPMTSTPHFTESRDHGPKDWGSAPGHWRGWMRKKQQMLGWVKSMSGNTQELLGLPDLEWLAAR